MPHEESDFPVTISADAVSFPRIITFNGKYDELVFVPNYIFTDIIDEKPFTVSFMGDDIK